MDMKKDRARNIRHDMINLLDNIVNESTRLENKLRLSQQNDDFSSNANTTGVAYGVLGGAIMALVKNESEYNTLVQQIAEETTL
jgi:hypothetical protein